MKKSIQYTEHVFLPLVLACLNIGLVHFIYLFATRGLTLDAPKILVALALAFLGSGLVYKRKWLLLGATAFYLVVLVGSLEG